MHLARIFMDHLTFGISDLFRNLVHEIHSFLYLLIVPMFVCMLMCMFRPTVDLKLPLISLLHPQTHTHPHTYKPFYKITKIVRAL